MKVTLPDGALWRSGQGFDTVHHQTCSRLRLGRAIQWNWANGKSLHELAESRRKGLRFCRVCDPLGDYAAAEKDKGAS